MAETVTRIGKLTNQKKFNEWAKAVFTDQKNGQVLSVVGKLVFEMETNKPYEVVLEEKVHPKWGMSYEVVNYMNYIECSVPALTKYLVKHFKGIGKVTAEKMVKDYEKRDELDHLRECLLSNPYAIDFTPYTNRPVTAQMRTGLINFINNALFLRFGAVKNMDSRNYKMLAAWLVDVLNNRYNGEMSKCKAPVNEALEIFIENPYEPIKHVDYYGFMVADSVGLFLGFARDHQARLSALAAHVLKSHCDGSGNVYLEGQQFATLLRSFDNTVTPKAAVDAALADGQSIVKDGNRYYPGLNFSNECDLAMMLAERLKTPARALWTESMEELDKALDRAEEKFGVHMDESQRGALVGIFTATTTLHSLTAGPGCGKTQLMQLLMDVLHNSKIIRFCAPTGKAAKVLNERISEYGLTATTIHSMLGVRGPGKFTHNSSNPLPCDILIADESGMNDLSLTRAMFGACKANTHIIFLGDTKQLPSIGPGNVLADYLRLQADHYRLTKTHRNQGGILEVVKQIGDGQCYMKPYEDVKFYPLPEASFESIEQVLEIYAASVRENQGDLSKVGLLVARRKGNANEPGWNVTYLNEQLRSRFNHDGARIPGTVFRVNDRIIIRKNATFPQINPANLAQMEEDDEKVMVSVVNGDTGFIIDYLNDPEDAGRLSHLMLKLDDDSIVYYPSDMIQEMGLAYAITVHASQGSEYNHVLFLNVNGSPTFIHRGIAFTAASRAKKKLHIFSQPEVMHQVCQRPIPPRNTYLVERVEEFLQG